MCDTFPECCDICKFKDTPFNTEICVLCGGVYRDVTHTDIDLIMLEEV